MVLLAAFAVPASRNSEVLEFRHGAPRGFETSCDTNFVAT